MVKLTANEKQVFYGISKWPESSDEELSSKINVKRSTVTAIRNKLERGGFYEKINIPNLGKLGCELIVARYGDFNPLTPWSKRKRQASREPELFYRISTDTSRISLVTAKDFTEIKRYLETAAHRHGSHGYLTKTGVKHVYYPLALSSIPLFFDFPPILNKHFNLGFKEETKVFLETKKPEQEELSETEKHVLYMLVKHPTLKDKEIAKKLLITRQTVNNTRSKLVERELIKTTVFPDLAKLGFEIIAFAHIEINKKIPLNDEFRETREKVLEEIIKEGSHYVISSGDMDDILLSTFKNYTDLEKTYSNIINAYTKNNFIDDEEDVNIKIYPAGEIKNHMKARCGPLVKKILGIKKEL